MGIAEELTKERYIGNESMWRTKLDDHLDILQQIRDERLEKNWPGRLLIVLIYIGFAPIGIFSLLISASLGWGLLGMLIGLLLYLVLVYLIKKAVIFIAGLK